MFNSVWAMTNSCNILGLWSQTKASSLALCTVDRNERVTVFWRRCTSARGRRSGRHVGIGLFHSLLNQFFSIAVVQSYTKTLIHCMLLTYLASLPGCFSAFKWQQESWRKRQDVSKNIIVFPPCKQWPVCLSVAGSKVHICWMCHEPQQLCRNSGSDYEMVS